MPLPGLLEEYDRIIPGAAERMLSMAERNQRAQVDAELIPIRAEAWSLKVATFAISFFPWVALAATMACLLAGEHVGAAIGAVATAATAGPQIIAATRRPVGGRRKKD